MATERRRVVAGWRIRVLAGRLLCSAGHGTPDETLVERLIASMLRRGDLAPIEGARGVYLVNTPFAGVLPVPDEQVVQEADPWAVFHLLTALAHHGLTREIPAGRLQVAHHPSKPSAARIPLGTTPEDWVEIGYPTPAFPRRVGSVRVEWMRQKAELDFGIGASLSQGLAIYVTDLERSLLDSIRWPRRAGGVSIALGAWRRARDRLDLDRLVEYVERIASPVMTQRAGFLIERLGLVHAALDRWRGRLQRGGSLRLVADAPYAPTYSERWNLSLNVPGFAMAELDAPDHA